MPLELDKWGNTNLVSKFAVSKQVFSGWTGRKHKEKKNPVKPEPEINQSAETLATWPVQPEAKLSYAVTVFRKRAKKLMVKIQL